MAAQLELQTDYFLEHFEQVLLHLERSQRQLLGPRERAFIAGYQALPTSARRLLVRLANRKGKVFLASDLQKHAKECRPEDVTVLRRARLLGPIRRRDLPAWQQKLRKAQLAQLLTRYATAAVPPANIAALRKAELLPLCSKHLDYSTLIGDPLLCSSVVLLQRSTIDYLFFLVFGSLRSNLSEFVLRDLGLRGVQSRQEDFTARFRSRTEALHSYLYRRLEKRIAASDDTAVLSYLPRLSKLPQVEAPDAFRVRERIIADVAKRLRALKQAEAEQNILKQSQSSENKERYLRLLFTSGAREEAKQHLEAILAEPSTESLYLFAEDFYARKFGGRAQSRLSLLLKESEVIRLSAKDRGRVEHAVQRSFERKGCKCFYSENQLWRALFGALFFDVLYEAEKADFASEFDRVPCSLRNGNFYRRHEPAIEARLEMLADPATLFPRLHDSFDALRAQQASFFPRDHKAQLAVCRFLTQSALQHCGVAAILRAMAKDFRREARGFPDLCVFAPEGVRFVEVKAEGDTLRPEQLRKMLQLENAGFRTEVLRVLWRYDQRQAYTVVDVETTGGSAERDRVIELAAIRIKAGREVARFHSLINPERRLPPMIRRLTGIDDSMLKEAPHFKQLAQEFLSFCEGSIFVAHNVNFDYGFLRQEYRRLEQDFNFPKFCTCVGARRVYRHAPSYGLKPLCKELGIELRRHHRALDDASATARLLLKLLESGRFERGRSARLY